ncbi:hypothetical protein D9M71_750910 [compost metagenome]
MGVQVAVLRGMADVAAGGEHQGVEACQVIAAEAAGDIVTLHLPELRQGAAGGGRLAPGDGHVMSMLLEVERRVTADQTGSAHYENLHCIVLPAGGR